MGQDHVHNSLKKRFQERNRGLSIAYYRTLADANWDLAKKQTEDFARLFMVPGMQHCSGGPGPNTFDTLAALDQWVANGIAPDQIIASHLTAGVVDFTRPLCPYPQVAA